jgi:hypothetical protein
MPGKPSRSDRRKIGQSENPAQRRPRPAPAVRSTRPVPSVKADEDSPSITPGDPGTTEESAPESTATRRPGGRPADGAVSRGAPPSQGPGAVGTASAARLGRPGQSRPAGGQAAAGRPRGSNAARATELQRELRTQQDSVHDLKVTAIVAGITTLGLIGAVAIS